MPGRAALLTALTGAVAACGSSSDGSSPAPPQQAPGFASAALKVIHPAGVKLIHQGVAAQPNSS
jgi:hypothetical protein